MATNFTLSCLRITSTSGAAVAAVQPSSSRRGPPSSSGTPWSARIFGERPVLVGDHGFEFGLELDRVEFAHPFVLAWNHDVDAVWTVADMLIQPGQLNLEFFSANPTAPRTPMPPALDTAAATSRQ